MNASPVLERGAELAAATDRIVIGSSVASIWNYDPRQLAESFLRLDEARPGRFLLGIGISHAPIVERTAPGREYDKPVETMNRWLDEMDALRNGVPSSRRIVAALAPRMLRLAGVRSLGSHPYLVPVGHSQVARRLLGPRALLAPAHAVVVEPDEARARAIGRRHINNPYLQLPNYAKTWMRHGLEPADLENGGSDRLVDELVAWGPPAAIAVKLGGHIAAGADHVAVQVLGDDSGSFPRSQWRALAAVLVR
jgi:probable F420-dependent oxidoreductase